MIWTKTKTKTKSVDVDSHFAGINSGIVFLNFIHVNFSGRSKIIFGTKELTPAGVAVWK